MERTIRQYNDYMVRMPVDADIKPLKKLVKSQGWIFVSIPEMPSHPNLTNKFGKGLTGLRGILQSPENGDKSFDTIRKEALSEKYGIDL